MEQFFQLNGSVAWEPIPCASLAIRQEAGTGVPGDRPMTACIFTPVERTIIAGDESGRVHFLAARRSRRNKGFADVLLAIFHHQSNARSGIDADRDPGE
jgi:hypothetical protein